MRNRWGIDVRKGMIVKAHHPRGGVIAGTVKAVTRMSGYGYRATLNEGYSVGLDDIYEATQVQHTGARAKNPLRRRGPPKGKVPPQLRKFQFKKGRR